MQMLIRLTNFLFQIVILIPQPIGITLQRLTAQTQRLYFFL